MSLVGAKVDDPSNWFMNNLHNKVEYGIDTSFLEDPWVGNTILSVRFL